MITLQLIHKAQQGDETSLQEVFEDFNNIIHFSVKKFFIAGGDKEDVIQEARLGLLKAINYYKVDKNASFKTFAVLCIKRHLISAIKSSNSGKNKILNSALSACAEEDRLNYGDYHVLGSTASYHNPEEIYLEKEKYNDLMKYVKINLSKMEKELFEYILLEMTYIEIAEKTGRSSKSVDNAIQRIKKKLRAFFEEYDSI